MHSHDDGFGNGRWQYGLACAALSVVTFGCEDPDRADASFRDASPAALELLEPAPRQPLGHYDHFGELLTPGQAAQRVAAAGLPVWNPRSYQRLGMVRITRALLQRGEALFNHRSVGDQLGLQRVFGFGDGVRSLLPEIVVAIIRLAGQPTTNLQLTLLREVRLGSTVVPAGTVVDTGLDVEAGALLPLGLLPDGNVTCALCHVTLDEHGGRLEGVPNADINTPALIAISPNTAAGFARLIPDPLALVDPALAPGKTIIDSHGNLVTLPDPAVLERALDDLVMAVPPGRFESSTDGIPNTTEIPPVFTFGSKLFTAGGEFGVGPFSGLGAQTSSVHSSEVNVLEAAQRAEATLGIDAEVYLGIALQNAADPAVRLPDGAPVRPSEFLRAVAGPPAGAELEDQVVVGGHGAYPGTLTSLFTFNGLAFSPPTARWWDLASGPFLSASNAMAAWENSLQVPPNRGPDNQEALASGSVAEGAQIFVERGCADCHPGPFFTDNRVWPNAILGANSARARSRHGAEDLLVPPMMYTLDTPVPVPANAEVIALPTEGFSPTPTSLPFGHEDPEGGYKTPALRGLYLSPPYLHDGGAGATAAAFAFDEAGQLLFVDPSQLGIPASVLPRRPDAAASLRVLLDAELRAYAVGVNQSIPPLVISNLDGTGHDFYVPREEQAALIDFLLALDDDPGTF